MVTFKIALIGTAIIIPKKPNKEPNTKSDSTTINGCNLICFDYKNEKTNKC